ncbi:MAG: biotin--[acetyl-CoA-carboxylase] ligase, partial [Halobacteriaceae archaeon]
MSGSRVDPDQLSRCIDAPVHHEEVLPSTNDRARTLANDGARAGSFVIADEQTAGRGRGGSRWKSPVGGVWSTTILRPKLSTANVGRLTFAGGMAVIDVVGNHITPALKWPNDVLLMQDDEWRKVAGVLVESVVSGVPIAGKPIDDAF